MSSLSSSMVTPLARVRSVSVVLLVGVAVRVDVGADVDVLVVGAVVLPAAAAALPTAGVPPTPPQAASTNKSPADAAAVRADRADIRMIPPSRMFTVEGVPAAPHGGKRHATTSGVVTEPKDTPVEQTHLTGSSELLDQLALEDLAARPQR